MNIIDIRETASPNFYDAIADLKGVQMTFNNLAFKTVNLRGFSDYLNNRFLQIVDGIDNQIPSLNALRIDPMLDPLRSDPRFIELLKKVGLEK